MRFRGLIRCFSITEHQLLSELFVHPTISVICKLHAPLERAVRFQERRVGHLNAFSVFRLFDEISENKAAMTCGEAH
jgi:hypothetical protein